MEFRMNDLMIPEFTFNFDELKAELVEKVGFYENVVVTPDSVADAKKDLANLRKLSAALNDERKRVKKAALAPYEAFEVKVKELDDLILAPINAIAAQLKAFEEKRKEEKAGEIAALYSTVIPEEIQKLLSLTRIMEKRWLNAGTTMKQIEFEMLDRVSRVKADLYAIDAVEEKYRDAVRAEYYETLDIGRALGRRNALKEAAGAFQASEKVREEPVAQVEEKAPVEPEIKPESEKVYKLRLELAVTKKQSEALKKFLVENGIEHVKI